MGAAGGLRSLLAMGVLAALAGGFSLAGGGGVNLRDSSDVTCGFALDICFFTNSVFRLELARYF